MLLTLHRADEGGYLVTSPIDPELLTRAETIEEAFFMARDAAAELGKARVMEVKNAGGASRSALRRTANSRLN